MTERMEKILTVLAIITAILVISFIGFFIYEFNEMLNDHRCYNLPINEFFQDKKCEKYWRYRE